MKNKIITVILIILFQSILVFGEDFTLYGNYLKLGVNKDSRFNLYGRNSVNDKWTPLFFIDKAPSNYFRFFEPNNELPFTKAGTDRFYDCFIKDGKINYYWFDKKYRIEISYALISSIGDGNADSLKIELTIKNLSPNDVPLDYYLCLDTYLGEKSGNHFVLQDNFIVKKEVKIDNPENLSKISSLDKSGKFGVEVLFGAEGEIAPNMVYFANWKKVEKNIGLYSPIEGMNFDLLPSSINDSALFIEYHEQVVPAKNEQKYNFILKLVNNTPKNDKFTPAETPKKTESAAKSPLKNIAESEIASLDIKDLLELIDVINQKLDKGDMLNEEEVDLLNKLLTEVKKKRNIR